MLLRARGGQRSAEDGVVGSDGSPGFESGGGLGRTWSRPGSCSRGWLVGGVRCQSNGEPSAVAHDCQRRAERSLRLRGREFAILPSAGPATDVHGGRWGRTPRGRCVWFGGGPAIHQAERIWQLVFGPNTADGAGFRRPKREFQCHFATYDPPRRSTEKLVRLRGIARRVHFRFAPVCVLRMRTDAVSYTHLRAHET